MSCNQSRLVEFGGDVELKRDWALTLEVGEVCQTKGNHHHERDASRQFHTSEEKSS